MPEQYWLIKLKELLKRYPGSEILARVKYDLCDDGYMYSVGTPYKVDIDFYVRGLNDEYIFADDIIPYDEDCMFNVLETVLGYDKAEAIPDSELEQRFKALDWRRVILVYVK